MIFRLLSPCVRILRFALVACVCITAHAAVVRCTDAEGHVTYQDSSCARNARSDPVDATPNRGFRFAEQKEIERLQKERAASRIRDDARPASIRPSTARRSKPGRIPFNAGERRFITSGMSITDVRARIGPPDQVVRPSGATRTSAKDAAQNWIYRPAEDDPQTTTILSIRRGTVATVDRRVTR